MIKKIISLAIICAIGVQSAGAYMLGFKSWDNTPDNLVYIEKNYNVYLGVVGFIYDPWDERTEAALIRSVELLGKDRIYHLTMSPGMTTAQQVADGLIDDKYNSFFKLVKKLGINVVFRTMHEMNGGWYPRSSNPVAFQQARRHVWDLSRQAGLTSKNILFNMSVNGWDIPTRDPFPTQTSALFYCKQSDKKRLKCPTFEDYYPGDEYVDIMGMSFYNRGKGNGNFQWLTPYQIINSPQWHTLDRLKAYGKPLFVDEVGTTSVWYNEHYSFDKSREVYLENPGYKDAWLEDLRLFFENEPLIMGGIYFNVDLTNGLSRRVRGEQDRSIIDPSSEKVYSGAFSLFDGAVENRSMNSRLYALFGKEYMQIFGKKVLIETALRPHILELMKKAAVTQSTPTEKAALNIDAEANNMQAVKTLKKYQKTNYLRAAEYAKLFFATAKK